MYVHYARSCNALGVVGTKRGDAVLVIGHVDCVAGAKLLSQRVIPGARSFKRVNNLESQMAGVCVGWSRIHAYMHTDQ